MVTENIDIVVRERGARVVKRQLSSIGDTAQRSVRGLRLLQNALFVIGGAGLLRGLGRMVDTVTNFQNRLAILTTTTQQAAAVQRELFDVARRTRTEFDSASQVFTRTTLAVRSLGISARETLNFTESLLQSAILSGASVRETNAALIQMAQALASNRFSGDEFRSVSEQLPLVLDVIADELTRVGDGAKVTRGDIRQLGIEGKLTAEVILRAFRNGREELNERFANTIPTLSQSFVVFRNELLRTVGGINEFLGASQGIAAVVISVADNLDFLIDGIIAAGAAFATVKIANFISRTVKASRELRQAVASGNAVLLTSIEIERAKAASALQSAQATATETASKVRSIQTDVAQLQSQRALLLQQQASIVIDNQKRTARDALTGRFIVYNKALEQNIRTNVALNRTELALAESRTALTAATGRATAAESALTAAQGRSATATAAASTFGAKLARIFPGIAAGARVAAAALRGLFALIVANPVTAIIAAIVAAVVALALFSDKITITSDGVVTLRDVFIASFQLIMEAIAPVTNFLGESFSKAFTWISDMWNKFLAFVGRVLMAILNGVKKYVNLQIGLWVGLTNSVIKAWSIFPAALADIGRLAINGLITIVEVGINGVLAAIQGLLTFIGSAAEKVGRENPFKDLIGNVNLDEFKLELSGAAQEVGQIFNDEFSNALSEDYIGNAWTAVLTRARMIAEQRIADLSETGDGGGGGSSDDDGGGGKKKTFAEVVRELTLANELLKVNARERERLNAILKIEDELKRSLTESERGLVTELLMQNEVLTRAAEIYEDVKGPAQDYLLTLQAISELSNSGRISQDEFTNSVRRARIEFLDSQTSMGAGLERGFLKIIEKTGDFASQMEDIVTSAFDGMSQAIADFVVDGEADFGSLIKSINKQIIQLVVSQAFQQLFGGYTGGTGTGTGGNLFAGLVQGIQGLLGFQNGGSFQVGSQSGIAPLPGVDNRLVAFRAQDGENVTVTPKGQTPSGGGNTTVVNFNISTPDVKSFKQSESQLAARAARMISQGQRNM